jgi:hypothetical protein
MRVQKTEHAELHDMVAAAVLATAVLFQLQAVLASQ